MNSRKLTHSEKVQAVMDNIGNIESDRERRVFLDEEFWAEETKRLSILCAILDIVCLVGIFAGLIYWLV